MALVYEFVWRVLHVLLHIHRTLITWFRIRLRNWNGRLWKRALATLLVPITLGFPDHHKKMGPATGKRSGRRYRWGADGVLRRNNSRLQEEIFRQQQDLLGPEGSKLSVEFLSNGTDKHDYQVQRGQPVVRVLSAEDGKQSIVQAAQQLCREVEQQQRSSSDISVSLLDSLLRESKNIPDPDLVLKFGPVESTLGFLPWQIRLTEFISLPTHLDVSYEDLFGALQLFATCEQRVGK
ncbi:dehydrodolichyl diphosphate synthase complex subunit nus1 isoform X2 [Osmerus mordax]|uniref:dehydrodolichyl diphosphate synthase complex subunit nus1 isoform X2 n=1 Tax=Osmerus mordax TaxID=8014 RepID=UPI0035107746